MIDERINKDNIVIDLVAKNKKEVIEKLSELLATNGFVSDIDQFKEDVFLRENQMTTGIGNQIAIPHGKSIAVPESTVAVAKLKQPVEWDAVDSQLVNIVFLLAIEESGKGNEHLRILAELSEKLMDDDFIKGIKESKYKNELVEALAF